MRVAILDDYQNVALDLADWSAVASRADITVFLTSPIPMHSSQDCCRST